MIETHVLTLFWGIMVQYITMSFLWCIIVSYNREKHQFAKIEFTVPRIAFVAEYKVVMYTYCCKLSWLCYCDISLCYCDVRSHGSMQSAIFMWNNSTICHHNSSTMTGSIYNYRPPSGYSIRGTENCTKSINLWCLFLSYICTGCSKYFVDKIMTNVYKNIF